MNLKDTLEEFLSGKEENNFYESSVVTYRRKLEVFFEYLTTRCGANDDNFNDLLRGLGYERILNSVEFYIEEFNIKFKSTVDTYLIVLKAYFDFISNKYDITNENFDSTKTYKFWKGLIDNKIKELRLTKTKQKPPITKAVFEKLINVCDMEIDSFDLSCLINGKLRTSYSDFLSAIITKFVMFTGIKNNVILKILVEDLDVHLNKIRINGFWVHLPDKLGMQLKKYIKAREIILQNGMVNNTLFVNRQGNSFIKTDYFVMFKILKTVLGTQEAECVAKFSIIEMIANGIVPSIIQEFTGFGLDTYQHCQELLEENTTRDDLIRKSRYLDSKIRSIETLDSL